MSVTEFCDLHDACSSGRKWGMQYATMYDAYAAFLRGEGDTDHMIWVYCHAVTPQERTRFACWCVRQVWHLLTDERRRTAVETAERWADGMATNEELAAAGAAAWAAAGDAARSAERDAAWAGYSARTAAGAGYAAGSAEWAAARDAARDAAREAARLAQREYLVTIGNPFTPSSERAYNNWKNGGEFADPNQDERFA